MRRQPALPLNGEHCLVQVNDMPGGHRRTLTVMTRQPPHAATVSIPSRSRNKSLTENWASQQENHGFKGLGGKL